MTNDIAPETLADRLWQEAKIRDEHQEEYDSDITKLMFDCADALRHYSPASAAPSALWNEETIAQVISRHLLPADEFGGPWQPGPAMYDAARAVLALSSPDNCVPQSLWLPAMKELLSSHDNLYYGHFNHMPDCDPADDIAAKAARAIVERLTSG